MNNLDKFAEAFNLKYDEFPYSENAFSEYYDFPDNSCLYFNVDDNKSIDDYIDLNYHNILEEFSFTDLNFIFLPRFKISKELEGVLHYITPQLRNHHLEFLHSEKSFQFGGTSNLIEQEIYFNILRSINSKSDSKTGFIIRHNSTFYVLGFNHSTFFYLAGDVLQALIVFFKSKVTIDSEARDIFSSRFTYDPKEEIYNLLDEETKDKVAKITNQLEELKKSGQFLFALPIIKETLSNFSEELDLTSVSKIYIDSDNRVILPYFNNMEVKMSNLTKAIYLLFYKNPNGIDLQQLTLYRNQLLGLYFSISSYEDLDKLTKSVNDVVDISTKAIFTHISRIKSAFQKVMAYEVAKHYIISSDYHGGSLKYIPILKPQNKNENEDELPF